MFAFLWSKGCISPIKALNKDYKKIDEVPLDIQIRDKIGKSVDLDKLYLVSDIAKELIESKDYSNTIENTQKNFSGKKERNYSSYNIRAFFQLNHFDYGKRS